MYVIKSYNVVCERGVVGWCAERGSVWGEGGRVRGGAWREEGY